LKVRRIITCPASFILPNFGGWGMYWFAGYPWKSFTVRSVKFISRRWHSYCHGYQRIPFYNQQ